MDNDYARLRAAVAALHDGWRDAHCISIPLHELDALLAQFPSTKGEREENSECSQTAQEALAALSPATKSPAIEASLASGTGSEVGK